jgi:cyclic di-GMP phosphodiesterase
MPQTERSPERVLVVDDDPAMRRLLGRILERAGYEWSEAADSEQAYRALNEHDFALVLSDVKMPGDSGLNLVRHVLAEHPDVAVVMVTGIDDPELAASALDYGAYGYIIKPFSPSQITIAVANALRRRKLEIENRSHREMLEQIVRERTAALEHSARQLKLSREETVRRMSRAVEFRDEETGLHTERVSRYCELLAEQEGLDGELLRTASPMHDVGKVAVPDRILLKPGQLTDEERRQMERHTEVGFEILSGSGSDLLDLAASIALTHHEKYDGSGYPRGLKGEQIPVEGRIAAIADVFDALTTDRVYRPAYSFEQAVEMMTEERGRHFDPELLDHFLAAVDKIDAIRLHHADSSPQVGRSIVP